MVHNHNMEFREFDRDYAHARDYRAGAKLVPDANAPPSMGIVRDDGRVATRNFVGILSTVNCSATVVARASPTGSRPSGWPSFPTSTASCAFSHGLGCGMEMTGEPMDLLRRTLAGYARHANLAGVLIVGLGCERNQMSGLLQEQRPGRGIRC